MGTARLRFFFSPAAQQRAPNWHPGGLTPARSLLIHQQHHWDTDAASHANTGPYLIMRQRRQQAQLHMQSSTASAPFDRGKQATTCGKSKRTHEKEDRRMRKRVIRARMQWAGKWVRERMQGRGGGAAHRLLFCAVAQDLQIMQRARPEVFQTFPPPCPSHLHEWSKGLACLTCCGASHTGLQGVAQGFCRAAVRWVCMCAVHGHARKRSRQGREHT